MSKADSVKGNETVLEAKLRSALLLSRRVAGDYLVLDDATLGAAIDGSRPLGAAERAALSASPLTLRRFKTLADQARAARAARAAYAAYAAYDAYDAYAAPAASATGVAAWHGSAGMLRAADSGDALRLLSTDDGHWSLHFIDTAVPHPQRQVVLQLDAGAPFAGRLLGTGAVVEARDGAGNLILQGVLDGDGECEQAWPFADAPALHFQRHGAAFTIALANRRS